MLISLYTLFAWFLTPFLPFFLSFRAQKGKEDANRLSERWGHSSATAFDQAPVWVHAASVGEVLCALTLIDLLRAQSPHLPVLLTTGTVTAAQLSATRLPAQCVHQYAPLDHPAAVTRFLNHWRPCLALRVESELWPITLMALKQRGIPSLLLNAHMSQQSFARWSRAPRTIRSLLNLFKNITAESIESAEYLSKLSGHPVTHLPNLKFIADTPPVEAGEIPRLRSLIGQCPVWLYASTHAGEEDLAARLHSALRVDYPHLLTMIAPRHPARATDIADRLIAQGYNVQRRSADPAAPINLTTDIYLVDTMGELGLFYRLSLIAVLGRSFSRDGGGGHNPIEPALVAALPLSGPAVHNLQSIYDTLRTTQDVEICATPEDLRATLHDLLAHPEKAVQRGAHARQTVVALQQQTRDAITCILAANLPAAATPQVAA